MKHSSFSFTLLTKIDVSTKRIQIYNIQERKNWIRKTKHQTEGKKIKVANKRSVLNIKKNKKEGTTNYC